MTHEQANTLADHALSHIKGYLNNKIIMDWVNNEVHEKIAEDVRAKTGSGTTAKAVELMLQTGNDKTIVERYEKYLQAALYGVYLSAMKDQA